MAQATEPVERIHYARTRGGITSEVIYDVYADGRETFAEREFGELRWYDFLPSAPELLAARRLQGRGLGQCDSLTEINLDDLPAA